LEGSEEMASGMVIAIKIAITGYALLIISLFAFYVLTEIFVKLMRRLDEKKLKREHIQNS